MRPIGPAGSSLHHPSPGEIQPSAREFARLLRQHLREVLAVAALVTALAVAYAFLATPIYSADVLVRVDALEPNMLGIAPQGQVAAQPVQPPTDAEIAIMQSRAVVEPVMRQYHFDIIAEPRRLPVLGELAALLAKPGEPAAAWLGLDSYAWGGEQIEVGAMQVPPQWEDVALQLRALGADRYDLLDPSGRVLLSGTVGQTARENGLVLLVTRLAARPGTLFEVTAANTVTALRRFAGDLKISDDGKGTGVVRIAFTDADPLIATGVANRIAQSYLDSTVASNRSNDSKTLAFLEQELPRLRGDMERAEAALAGYRIASGSMQPAAEAQLYLQGGIDFQRQIAALQIQRTQLLEHYMPNSPQVLNADQQLAQLNSAKHNFDERFGNMPASERKNADLVRNAKVAETIYTEMVAKAEELSVRRASTAGNAHIVDAAIRPAKPIKPNRMLVILGGIVGGLILGMAWVFIRRQVFGGVIDPMFVERYMSVPLFGALTYSADQMRLEHTATRALPSAPRQLGVNAPQPYTEHRETPAQATQAQGPSHAAACGPSDRWEPGLRTAQGLARAPLAMHKLPAHAHRLLARSFPHDPAIETLRSVRTAVRLEMLQAPNPMITLTSPTTGTGKTFVAANLAVLLAEAGVRVLLVDADMRCGNLAAYFSVPNAGGLAEVLGGQLRLRSALRSMGIENLTLLTCGAYPDNPSELLALHNLGELLQHEPAYELILIDTPPYLPVTDAAIVANQSGATLLVLRSGMQSAQDLESAVRGLDRTGARLVGAIFNGIPARASAAPGYGYAAQYTYEARAKAARAAHAG
jgi:tyrosine-protein kinase Etk/Wzc